MKPVYILISTLMIIAGCAGNNGNNGNHSNDGKVEFRPDEAGNKIEVYIGDKLFTNYFYPGDMEKPVLYPIYTASGKDITRGYPYNPKPFERTDHPHHVGLWLNFGDVNGLDFWNNSFAVDPENRHLYGSIRFNEIIRENPGAGELVVSSDWVDHENTSLLSEETTFIFAEKNGIRTIERTSHLTAVQDVRFKGNKEGLLGLRLDRAFEEPSDSPQSFLDSHGNITEVRVVNTEGVNGVYRNADGQTGGEVWGERSPWVALSAEKDGEIVTIAIFDHKKNPYYPAWSHARGYGLFAVNNLGGRGMHDDAEDVEINLSPGETVSFSHLIAVGGDLSNEELNRLFNDYNSSGHETPIRALLITGGGWHDYETQEGLLTAGISDRLGGEIEWTIIHEGDKEPDHHVSILQEQNWADAYDVVVHNTGFGRVTDPDFVARFVEHHKGTPAVLIHAAVHSYRYAEPADPWFDFVGLQSMRHEGLREFEVENIAPDHPVMNGFPVRWQSPRDEVYIIERIRGDITPLAQAYGVETETFHPVAWTHEIGNTRVFATTLGHLNETFEDDEFLDMVTNGLLWAAGRR